MNLSAVFSQSDLIYLGTCGTGTAGHYDRYLEWLAAGNHGEMAYLEKNLEIRKDPRHLLPGARSVILFAMPYYQGDRLSQIKLATSPHIAQYARLDDYHKTMKRLAKAVVDGLAENLPPFSYRITVDSAPVLERAFASFGAQGFIGKNTCFIHFEKGSFILLGEILTDLAPEQWESLPSLAKSETHPCEKCNRCQVHCPTGALGEDFKLDARKCLAYWTIEHRGTIPEEFWPYLKEYVFGCDLCQLVCPFNSPSRSPRAPASLRPRSFPPLYEMATMDLRQYQTYFGGTPLTRAKRNGLRRNALIALAVTKSSQLNAALEYARSDGGTPIEETVKQIERYISN